MQLYMVVSIWVGVVISALIVVLDLVKGSDEKIAQEHLDDYVEKGHLQKGVYGERVVYHENDLMGENAVKFLGFLGKLKKYSLPLFICFKFVLFAAVLAIFWPPIFCIVFYRMRKGENK